MPSIFDSLQAELDGGYDKPLPPIPVQRLPIPPPITDDKPVQFTYMDPPAPKPLPPRPSLGPPPPLPRPGKPAQLIKPKLTPSPLTEESQPLVVRQASSNSSMSQSGTSHYPSAMPDIYVLTSNGDVVIRTQSQTKSGDVFIKNTDEGYPSDSEVKRAKSKNSGLSNGKIIAIIVVIVIVLLFIAYGVYKFGLVSSNESFYVYSYGSPMPTMAVTEQKHAMKNYMGIEGMTAQEYARLQASILPTQAKVQSLTREGMTPSQYQQLFRNPFAEGYDVCRCVGGCAHKPEQYMNMPVTQSLVAPVPPKKNTVGRTYMDTHDINSNLRFVSGMNVENTSCYETSA